MNSRLGNAWKKGKRAVPLVLLSLIVPKCFACLHIYAWAIALLAGSQVELCGVTAPSHTRTFFELLFVVAMITATVTTIKQLLNSLASRKQCPL